MALKEDETFEGYYKKIKDDFNNSLEQSGIGKHDMPLLLKEIMEISLIEMAKRFWQIKTEIDNIPNLLEAAIPQLMGGGYQPNKSDLDDSKPPQDTGASK